MSSFELIRSIESGGLDDCYSSLYPPEALPRQRARYIKALAGFISLFGEEADARLFSAPGRCELGGNHTDHQSGRVLAAAVSLDVACAAAVNDEGIIRIHSEGYPLIELDLESVIPRADERNASPALVRGIAAACIERGYAVGGFDAYMQSDVIKGSGLSSSAAFEVAVGTIISGLYNGSAISAAEIAQIGQYAENIFFGKPSGLMDQMASSVGGLIAIDFANPEKPLVERIDFDFSKSGYTLCIVDTKGSHANLTHEYAAIPEEMLAVAQFFGKSTLRELDEGLFYSQIPALREKCGDRAVLRAIHFFGDNKRVESQVAALRRADLTAFLGMLSESGRSSAMYLQNLYSIESHSEQGLGIACALSERILSGGFGAWRVQGGGFAGTIEAFVHDSRLDDYLSAMRSVFGEDSCHILSIRPTGGIELTVKNRAGT